MAGWQTADISNPRVLGGMVEDFGMRDLSPPKFTDPKAFEENGWTAEDGTSRLLEPEQFDRAVSVRIALRALGVSDEAEARGANTIVRYERKRPWRDCHGLLQRVNLVASILALFLADN